MTNPSRASKRGRSRIASGNVGKRDCTDRHDAARTLDAVGNEKPPDPRFRTREDRYVDDGASRGWSRSFDPDYQGRQRIDGVRKRVLVGVPGNPRSSVLRQR